LIHAVISKVDFEGGNLEALPFLLVHCLYVMFWLWGYRTYLFRIPFCASTITLLNNGSDVISEEVIEIVVYQLLVATERFSRSVVSLPCRIPFCCVV
jgi:hypothetical protein